MTDDERTVAASSGTDQLRAADSQATDAQIAANRANARKSTGPRTREGKARSSQNPTRHGVYSKGGTAIRSGQFAEDPDALQQYEDDLVEALRPRDAIEVAAARNIARAQVRFERLGNLEAAAISFDTTQHPDSGDLLIQRVAMAVEFAIFENEHVDPSEWDYEARTRLLKRFEAKKINLPGLLDDTATPSTPAEWRTAFKSLINHLWPGNDDAFSMWLDAMAPALQTDIYDAEARRTGIAASRTLNGTHGRTATLYGQTLKQMRGHLEVYSMLQARDLDQVLDMEE